MQRTDSGGADPQGQEFIQELCGERRGGDHRAGVSPGLCPGAIEGHTPYGHPAIGSRWGPAHKGRVEQGQGRWADITCSLGNEAP